MGRCRAGLEGGAFGSAPFFRGMNELRQRRAAGGDGGGADPAMVQLQRAERLMKRDAQREEEARSRRKREAMRSALGVLIALVLLQIAFRSQPPEPTLREKRAGRKYGEMYPFYLDYLEQHNHPHNRALHVVGTSLVLMYMLLRPGGWGLAALWRRRRDVRPAAGSRRRPGHLGPSGWSFGATCPCYAPRPAGAARGEAVDAASLAQGSSSPAWPRCRRRMPRFPSPSTANTAQLPRPPPRCSSASLSPAASLATRSPPSCCSRCAGTVLPGSGTLCTSKTARPPFPTRRSAR